MILHIASDYFLKGFAYGLPINDIIDNEIKKIYSEIEDMCENLQIQISKANVAYDSISVFDDFVPIRLTFTAEYPKNINIKTIEESIIRGLQFITIDRPHILKCWALVQQKPTILSQIERREIDVSNFNFKRNDGKK